MDQIFCFLVRFGLFQSETKFALSSLGALRMMDDPVRGIDRSAGKTSSKLCVMGVDSLVRSGVSAASAAGASKAGLPALPVVSRRVAG